LFSFDYRCSGISFVFGIVNLSPVDLNSVCLATLLRMVSDWGESKGFTGRSAFSNRY